MAVSRSSRTDVATHQYASATSLSAVPARTRTVPVSSLSVPIKHCNYSASKRILDILIAGFGIIAGLPLFVIVGLLVRLTSRGAMIFKQTRVGQGGKLFTCYKFRSMCVDAEERKTQLMSMNEVSGPVFKIKNDPRMTPVGRIIRKLSLDELPQLINVLKGDMSIVGPRPPVPDEVAKYSGYELGRLAVKPGLTCLWQISGRSNISFEHWVELDHAYIDTMTFWGDVKIILMTIPAVLTAKGAH